MKDVVVNNIAETENYLKYYGHFDKYSVNKIRYSLKYIRITSEWSSVRQEASTHVTVPCKFK